MTDEGCVDIVAGALILTPDSPSAPQPSSQNSSMLSPAPAPGPLGGNDMPQSSGLSIGAIAGIAVGGAVAAVMALGVLLRLCCCRSCGHHGARSARQESAPCTSLSEHSSPWEKVGRPTLCSGRARSYRMSCSQLLKKQAYTPDINQDWSMHPGFFKALHQLEWLNPVIFSFMWHRFRWAMTSLSAH